MPGACGRVAERAAVALQLLELVQGAITAALQAGLIQGKFVHLVDAAEEGAVLDGGESVAEGLQVGEEILFGLAGLGDDDIF